MATERVTERPDGTRETVVETGGGTTYVEKGGSGMGGILIGIAVLALVAIVAFFLLNANKNDAIRTDAVSSAASTVSKSAANAGDAVADAANSVNPNK